MVGNGCFKCGIVGHYKWNCPLKDERIVCYSCHQPGHARRECPYQHLNMGLPLSGGQTVSNMQQQSPKMDETWKNRLVGEANEATVTLKGLSCPALLDTGSTVATMHQPTLL